MIVGNTRRLRAWAATLAVGVSLAAAAEPGEDAQQDARPDTARTVYRPLPDREAGAGGGVTPGLEREVEGPLSGGGIGKTVAVVDVQGVIDLGLSPFVKSTVLDGAHLDMVILDIDTPGGRVDAAIQIRDALLASEIPTVAWINPRAISAGALISYACETIAMKPGGSMGAATPVQLQPGGGASEVGEKMVSYFRTEMAATARARGRRGDIAEAMVDPDVQIEGITPSGKLLTLDTDNALALGVADVLAGSLDELLSALYMDGARIVRPTPSWAHRLARLFTHPAVSGLLMTLGLLGILIELRAPGFGAPGIVGIAALVLFFFGHHVVHLAGWEELLLFGLGVVLLLVEGFVIPGFGFVGVLGAAAVVASLVLALSGLPLGVSFSSGEITTSLLRVLASVALSIGGFALAALVLPRTRAGRPLVLRMKLPAGSSHDGRPAGASSTAAPTFERGDRGRSLTILRPAGKVRVRGRVTVAESEGPFIDRDREVVVVRVHGDRVLVREIPDDGVG